MGTSKSIPCLGPTWRGSSPYLQVNMKKLSFQHTCEQGTVLIGPHLQTWQRFLRWSVPWVGSMRNDVVRLITYIIWLPSIWEHGNMEWIYLQYAMDWYPNQIPWIPKTHLSHSKPPFKTKGCHPFLLSCCYQSRRSLNETRWRHRWSSAPFFRLEGGANVGKCSKLLTSLEPLAFSASGLLQMSFFWKHRDYMETYLNILAPTLHKHPDIENDIKGHENRQYQFNINQNHKIQSKFPKISWTKCFHFFFVSESSELWKIGLMPRALTHPIGRRMSPENIQLQRNHAHWTLIYFDVISSTKIPWGRSLCEVTVHFFGDKNDA